MTTPKVEHTVTLQKTVLDRLRAGALVILVEEPDEILAVAACEMAAKAMPGTVPANEKCKVLSILDEDFQAKFDAHKKDGKGVLIIADFLRANGTNPTAVRMIREFALQTKAPPYPRLILVEAPGVEMPATLKGDMEYILPPLPSVAELKQELEVFITDQAVTLEGNGEMKHAIAQSMAGLARHEAARLLARCWVEKKTLDPAWLSEAKALRVTERLNGALTFIDPESADVGGQADLRQWVQARRKRLGSKKAADYGLPELKGLMIAGIPGTGKSLDVKHITKEFNVPLLRLDIGKLFGSLVGQSESQVRQALEAAEACAPCVLWIDEIEKGLGGVAGGGGDGGTSLRVFGTILTWMQEKKKPVFVVATANRVFDLPPELLRKGRFDEIFFVDLPTAKERQDIVKIHVERRGRFVTEADKVEAVAKEAAEIAKIKGDKPQAKMPLAFILDPQAIATMCSGFSGAEIEQVILDGMSQAYSEDREVQLRDVLEAAAKTMPLSKTMAEDITKLRAWAKGRARMASLATEEPAKVEGQTTRVKLDLGSTSTEEPK